MAAPSAATGSFSIEFGKASSETLRLAIPVLGGSPTENLFPGVKACGRFGSLDLSEADDWLVGRAVVPVRDLEDSTSRLYAEVFSTLGDRRLARCWNYVPGINEDDASGLENYRVFCRGRSLAFERRFGSGFSSVLPAASAVGGPAGLLVLVFAACRGTVAHLENPLQVPAYEYPKVYGPRPPSFSRATVVTSAGGRTVFVSGTAAVRGSRTVAPSQAREQVLCTLRNLEGISAACGLGHDLARGAAARRHFKVYVRHAHEYTGMAELLESRLFAPTDTVSYVQADICRRDLNVEIEATIDTH